MRIAVLWLLFYFTDGKEFTMDLWIFELGLDPFSVITFSTDVSGFSQPPFFPFALAPLALLTSLFFDQFLASRISFTIFEFIGFLIVARYLSDIKDVPVKAKRSALVILSISPIGFMAGTVMRTEEAIVMIFTSVLILAMKNNRIKAASIIVFLGIITGKILFSIMFFPLLLASNDVKKVFKWGILPALIFLIPYCVTGYIITGEIPFVEFSPDSTTFCLSIFSLGQHYVGMTGTFMKWLSSALVLGSFAIIWKFRERINLRDFPGLALLSFIILFLLFYHITPEYLIFALPLLAVLPIEFNNVMKRWVFNGLHAVLAIASSGFGVAYGLRIYLQDFGYKSPSKDMALNTYRELFGCFSLEIIEQFLLAVSIVSLSIMLLIVIRHLSLKFARLR